METKILVSLLVLCASMTVGYGLKCYVCENDAVLSDEGVCGDPFDIEDNASKNVLLTCNSNERFCKKEKSGVNNAWTNVKRSCAATCEDENILYVDRTDCCATDGCNSASGLAASVALLMTSLATLYKMM